MIIGHAGPFHEVGRMETELPLPPSLRPFSTRLYTDIATSTGSFRTMRVKIS